ncbi:hypothetical protein [Halorussus lipolyticus]|uniref:hypothetical protein n=1 Tax=Halorussus lipolyticus TaxID=3034024 RepID=UPI0023E84AC1|nr:hypothetical protein [Halorussus sp. DT80]
MDVITALEAASGDGGYYHLLNEDATASVCGTVQKDTLFAGQAHEILPKAEAEQQGLEPCARCIDYAEETDT